MSLFSICLIILVCNLFPAAVDSLNGEGLGLFALKQSITQDPRNSLLNWNPSDPNPCLWNGIACREDRVVSVSIPNQNLVGSLPPAFANLSALRHLNLRNNNFSGSLPAELFDIKGLQSLVLSGNSFSGLVPSGIGNLGSLQILDLSENSFEGPMPPLIVQCKRLKVLNLSGNGFSGTLPVGVGDSLVQLESLNVSFNKLSGLIPSDLGNLSSLQEPLDLSHNLFTGSIPPNLGNLPERIYIDLSYNNLSGPIPETGVLLDSGPTAFKGNPLLCGLPLNYPCPPGTPGLDSNPIPHFPTQESGNSSGKQGHILGKGILIVIIPSAMVVSCFIGWAISHHCKNPTQHACGCLFEEDRALRKELFCLKNDIVDVPSEKMDQYSFFPLHSTVNFDLDKLLKAPAYLLGKSGIGMVYRVVLEDGTSLAVRRLGEGGSQRLKDFQSEVEAIAKIKHPNVVPLRAYCWAEDEKLLIYDFIPNKDLATAIHGKAGAISFVPLSWAARLRIMKGIAKGLAFLHEFSPKRYIHGDLKPSNVLLGLNMEPYISDFGLARLASLTGESSRLQLEQVMVSTPEQQTSPYEFTRINSTQNLRSYYQSPEAVNAGKPSQKWDVYSFGMVLLEMIMGKLPMVDVGSVRFDLVSWTDQSLKEKVPLSEVIDSFLLHDLDKEEEMEAVIRIALACLQKSPERRPSMRQVMNGLEKIGQIY